MSTLMPFRNPVSGTQPLVAGLPTKKPEWPPRSANWVPFRLERMHANRDMLKKESPQHGCPEQNQETSKVFPLTYSQSTRCLGRRMHFGCGENRLEGWENWDLPQVDIRRRLPFGDGVSAVIFLEHVIEHVTPQEGYRFFEDCLRVLEPGGVLRLAFPDPVRILRGATPGYLSWQRVKGWGDGTAASGVRAALFLHGHQNVCTAETLTCQLESLGFKVTEHRPRESNRDTMRNLECHGYRDPAQWESTLCQTTCLEAVKPS